MKVNKLKALFSRKHIYLNYSTPYCKYTFLEGIEQPQQLLNSLPQMYFKTKQFCKLITPHNLTLTYFALEQKHILDLQKNKSAQGLPNKVFELVAQYRQIKIQLLSNIEKEESVNVLLQTMKCCLALKIFQVDVWQKLFCYFKIFYEQMQMIQKQRALILMNKYLMQRFTAFYERYAHKLFMFPEKYLADLFHIKQMHIIFYKDTLSFSQNPDPQEQRIILNIFNLQFNFFLRMSHTQDLNLVDFKAKLKIKQKQMLYAVHICDMKTLINIYTLLAFFFQSSEVKPIIDVIHEKLQYFLVPAFKKSNILQQISTVSKILFAWNLNGKYNQTLLSLVVIPLIHTMIKTKKKLIHIAKSLLQLQIEDSNILLVLTRNFDNQQQRSREAHLIKHYLKAIKNINIEDSFPLCSSSRAIKFYLKESNCKIHSECMIKSSTRQKIRNQFHKTQHFWNGVILNAFKNNLQGKYGGNQDLLEFQSSFCVYELDWFMKLGKKGIAIEFAGSSYFKNSLNYVGKKSLKFNMIKSYGINILIIDSSTFLNSYFSQFKRFQEAEQYITHEIKMIMQK